MENIPGHICQMAFISHNYEQSKGYEIQSLKSQSTGWWRIRVIHTLEDMHVAFKRRDGVLTYVYKYINEALCTTLRHFPYLAEIR